jgi:hypothetical protein
MRVLIDECLPQALWKHLPAHEAVTAVYAGFSGLKNGALLQAAEDAGFEVFVTGDRSLEYEQNLPDRKLAVVALSANSWNIIKNHVPKIVVAIDAAQAGTVTRVDCGRFARPKTGSGAGAPG